VQCDAPNGRALSEESVHYDAWAGVQIGWTGFVLIQVSEGIYDHDSRYHYTSNFFYILLFTFSPPWAFHSLANSSSHATRAFKCSCFTGTLTLWCSAVQ
jgi:hypothetical protein